MENLDKFLNTYLKVEEVTEEKIKEAEIALKKKKGKNDRNEEWHLRHLRERMGCNKYSRMTHANVGKNLARNLYDDNIVAYSKDRFMAMVVIRGIKKFFAFVVKSNDLYLGGFQYSLMDLPLEEAVKKIDFLLADFPEGTKIDKPQLWQELKNTILAEAIQKSN
jgi:hypothetical protein